MEFQDFLLFIVMSQPLQAKILCLYTCNSWAISVWPKITSYKGVFKKSVFWQILESVPFIKKIVFCFFDELHFAFAAMDLSVLKTLLFLKKFSRTGMNWGQPELGIKHSLHNPLVFNVKSHLLYYLSFLGNSTLWVKPTYTFRKLSSR